MAASIINSLSYITKKPFTFGGSSETVERSLELEIAVPRKPLKLFISGGSGETIEISGIRDSNTREAINGIDV